MPPAGKLSVMSLVLVAPAPVVTPTVVTVPVQPAQGAKQVVPGKGPPGTSTYLECFSTVQGHYLYFSPLAIKNAIIKMSSTKMSSAIDTIMINVIIEINGGKHG